MHHTIVHKYWFIMEVQCEADYEIRSAIRFLAAMNVSAAEMEFCCRMTMPDPILPFTPKI